MDKKIMNHFNLCVPITAPAIKKGKITRKGRKFVLLAGSVALVVSLCTGCSKKKADTDRDITTIVSLVQDDTCFDEVVTRNHLNLEEVNKLEELLNLAKELHGLNFSRIEVDEKRLDSSQLLALPDIKKLVVAYQKEKSGKEVSIIEQDLSYQEKLINRYLCEKGYVMMESILMDSVKAKLLDASDLDESSYEKVSISPSGDGNLTNPEDELYVMTVVDNTKIKSQSNDNSIYDAVSCLYDIQSSIVKLREASFADKIEYNSDRIKLLSDAILKTKEVLLSNVSIDEDNFLFWNNGYKTKTRIK